jgi:hypothetical protein
MFRKSPIQWGTNTIHHKLNFGSIMYYCWHIMYLGCKWLISCAYFWHLYLDHSTIH